MIIKSENFFNENVKFLIDDSLVVFLLLKYCDVQNKQNMPIKYINFIDFIYSNQISFFHAVREYSDYEVIEAISFIDKNHEKIKNIYYKDMIDELLIYYNQIIKEMNEYFNISVQILHKQIGFDLSKTHSVYILPYFLKFSFTYNNLCFYGTEYKYPHIINIMHELMHCYFPDDDISHSIIELSTNGVLQNTLFGIRDLSIYLSGHWYLLNTKKKILKEWNKFTNSKQKNIYTFYHQQVAKIEGKKHFAKYYAFSNHIIGLPGYKNTLLIDEEKKDIISIPTELYNNLINDKLDSNNNEIVKELLSNGYIINKGLKKNISINSLSTDEKNIPILAIELINLCNYKCKHCYFYNENYRKRTTQKKFLSIDIIVKTIEILRFYGIQVINILGGEPLLVGFEYFEKLLKTIDRYPFIENINIYTNASLIDSRYIQLFTQYKKKLSIKITFHSYNAMKNDDIAGYKGDFDKKIQLTRLLQENGISVSANTVISKYNYDDIKQIENLCKELNVNYSTDLARISKSNSYLIDKTFNFNQFLINPFSAIESYIPDIDYLVIKNNKNSCWMNSLSLDYDNNLYVCAEMHNAKTKICNIDNVKDGSDIFDTNYKHLIKLSDTEKKCTHCEFKTLCIRCKTILKNRKSYGFESICKYNPYIGVLEVN